MARLGNNRVGQTQLGGGVVRSISLTSSSTSSITQNIARVLDISLDSASQSTVSFTIARVFVINLSSTSVSSFDFVLSEDSYAEQYGRERGPAELDIIVVGNAQVD